MQTLFSETGGRLLDAIGELSRARTLNDVTAAVRTAARELTGADGVTFVLRDGDRCYYVDEDAISPLWKGKRFPISTCISGWCMLHREQVVIEDIYTDERIPHDAYRPTFVKSLAMAPIRSKDPIGAIGAYWAEPHCATDDELNLMQMLADYASVALTNVELITALRRGEQRYRAIVEDQTEMITRWNGDGVRTFVNDAYARFFGKPREELIGTSFFDLIPEADRPAVRGKIARLTPDHPFETDEHRSIGPDGRTAWTEWTDRAICDDDGNIVEYQSVGRDVTERHNLEAQLLQSQKMESIGQLAGGIAHDLNNLLMPILSYSSMLLEDLRRDDPRREPLSVIHQAGEAAKELTHQLLAFGRAQLLDRAPVDLNELVLGFEQILRRTLREDIELRLSLDADPAIVDVDTGQIRQVLLNLVINAADAMPDGGRLSIRTERAEIDDPPPNGYTDIDPGPYVVLVVRDTGTGMEPRTLEHIFEPFFTTKPAGRGTGLGLSTCYGIVRQHGGDIHAESEIGHGTTFRVLLPAIDAEVAPAATREPRRDVGRRDAECTVLLAEDSRIVRRLVRRVLERAGFRVIESACATDAMRHADEHDGMIHVLLTDVVMPDGSGRELYDTLAARLPHLRVVFMSGYTADVVIDRGVLTDGAQFLQKPFNPDTLIDTIRRVIH